MKEGFTKQDMADVLIHVRDFFNIFLNDIQVRYLYELLRPLGIKRVKSILGHLVKNVQEFRPNDNIVSIFIIAVWEHEHRMTILDIVHQLNKICNPRNKKVIDNEFLIEDIIEHIAGDLDRLKQIPPQLFRGLVEGYVLTKTNKGVFKMTEYRFEETARLMREVIKRAEDGLAKRGFSEERKAAFMALSQSYLENIQKITNFQTVDIVELVRNAINESGRIAEEKGISNEQLKEFRKLSDEYIVNARKIFPRYKI